MQQLARALGGAALAAKLERDLHVLDRGERGDQLEALKHEPHFLAAQPGALVLVHRRQVGVVEDDLAVRRGVEAGEESEECRLAAARRPDDRDERALRNGERDVAQHGEPVLAAAIFLGQLSGNEHADGKVEGEMRNAGADWRSCFVATSSPLRLVARPANPAAHAARFSSRVRVCAI